MHSDAFSTISLHSIPLHSSPAAWHCILLHFDAFTYVAFWYWCICLPSYAFSMLHLVQGAFVCIQMHPFLDAFLSSVAFSCIQCTRCIHVHSLYVAFHTWCILTHYDTFCSRCILNVLHSTYDAFMCIILYSRALWRNNTRDRMRWNAPDCGTTHTYTREAERTQGQTHMWTQRIWRLDGLWACHKACPWSTHVPLHVIQVFIRLLSVP